MQTYFAATSAGPCGEAQTPWRQTLQAHAVMATGAPVSSIFAVAQCALLAGAFLLHSVLRACSGNCTPVV